MAIRAQPATETPAGPGEIRAHRATARVRGPAAAEVRSLQRQAGNAAVCALLASGRALQRTGSPVTVSRIEDDKIRADLAAIEQQKLPLKDLLGKLTELVAGQSTDAEAMKFFGSAQCELYCQQLGGPRLRLALRAALAKHRGMAWSSFVAGNDKELSELGAMYVDQIATILAYLGGPADLDLPEGNPRPAFLPLKDLAERIGKLLGTNVTRLGERAVEELNSYAVPDIAKVLGLLEKAGRLDVLAAHAEVRPLVAKAIKAFKDPNSITDADLGEKFIHKEQLKEFRATFHPVEDSFLGAFKEMCGELGCAPEHMLAVMLSETAEPVGGRGPFKAVVINPAAGTGEKGAAGLNQMMPGTQEAQGFTRGSRAFRDLTATDQLQYTRSFFAPVTGKLSTAGRIYAWNFQSSKDKFKAALSGGAIVKKGDRAYDDNAANLDLTGKGSITLEDLETLARRHVPDAKRVLNTLEERAKKTAAAADAGTGRDQPGVVP
ncbi:hypothetical protein [Amycolatopsis sp.]|uniref:hypothetical protein n=1 Tax=Amycolatopsis sp. TaxID=37632 RepID=UPI002D7FBB31|nr:hypothetical protein [Amycolatopsis sp.]HET6704219.1 hypothetical protein [Amycolatopsis sp.]